MLRHKYLEHLHAAKERDCVLVCLCRGLRQIKYVHMNRRRFSNAVSQSVVATFYQSAADSGDDERDSQPPPAIPFSSYSGWKKRCAPRRLSCKYSHAKCCAGERCLVSAVSEPSLSTRAACVCSVIVCRFLLKTQLRGHGERSNDVGAAMRYLGREAQQWRQQQERIILFLLY
jgi:hypothetical protein